jgi:hypothetical protein
MADGEEGVKQRIFIRQIASSLTKTICSFCTIIISVVLLSYHHSIIIHFCKNSTHTKTCNVCNMQYQNASDSSHTHKPIKKKF